MEPFQIVFHQRNHQVHELLNLLQQVQNHHYFPQQVLIFQLKKNLLKELPDGTLSLTRCCQVGGLGGNPYRDGSFEYYIGEKMRDNDAKATGPFIMGCIELGI